MNDDLEAVHPLDFKMVYVWMSKDSVIWSSQRLAIAWSEDQGLSDPERLLGFAPKNENRVWLKRESLGETFWEVQTEYTPKESPERIVASGLAKLTTNEKKALGLDNQQPIT